jgi:hypothetical protein
LEINYDYNTVPTLKRFKRSNARHRLVVGPFGSGKSSGMCWEIFKRGMNQEPDRNGFRRTRWAIIRNTYGQLKDTTIKTFLDWFPPEAFGNFNATDKEYTMRFAGPPDQDGKPTTCIIEIWFRALDDASDVRKLKSMELTGAWINEASEVPKAIFDVLDSRIDRFPSRKDGTAPTWVGIILDTNPPDDDHWLVKYFEHEGQPGHIEVYKQPPGLLADVAGDGTYYNLRHNPQAENTAGRSPDYYMNLARGKPPEYIKVFVMGEYGFAIDGKPVYPQYRDHVHYRESLVDPVKGLTITRCWDFGLTPACVFKQRTTRGQSIVFDELLAESMGFKQFAAFVKEHCARHYPQFEFRDVSDPAGQHKAQTDEQTCYQIARAEGIYMIPGLQTFQIRREAVMKGLTSMADGEPALIIGRKCQKLRKGFNGGYHFRRLKVSGDERYHDVPEKNMFSHLHDALQYGESVDVGYSLIRSQFSDLPDLPDTEGDYDFFD